MSSGFQQTSQDENEREREGSRSKRMQKSKIESNMGVLRCSAWGVREWVCVRMCVCERKREREWGKGRFWLSTTITAPISSHFLSFPFLSFSLVEPYSGDLKLKYSTAWSYFYNLFIFTGLLRYLPFGVSLSHPPPSLSLSHTHKHILIPLKFTHYLLVKKQKKFNL